MFVLVWSMCLMHGHKVMLGVIEHRKIRWKHRFSRIWIFVGTLDVSLWQSHSCLKSSGKAFVLRKGHIGKAKQSCGKGICCWHHSQLGQPCGAKWSWQNSQSSSLACPAIVYHHFEGKQGFITLVSATIHHRHWKTQCWGDASFVPVVIPWVTRWAQGMLPLHTFLNNCLLTTV